MVRAEWAIFEEDYWAITNALEALIQSSQAKHVLLVDRAGRLTADGQEPICIGEDLIEQRLLFLADLRGTQLGHHGGDDHTGWLLDPWRLLPLTRRHRLDVLSQPQRQGWSRDVACPRASEERRAT